ncbi:MULTISPECIES: HpcH/HpaI aldolase family protein [Prauserella salsuginis group]|uniref:4-hydroxy-2-oxoheptanedioate aldolase n=2 Tax=Prauserella salsuginis group TaxID=2893672 RepID=A0A839XNX2_9PSEU|nr:MULTISPECIES: aldolase/citrate lyase family protein [Prauserella salsuginis group]MBB3663609.1 4-hydroxy-2-oxoheptanedioate aldolase [Prauserella sediminis]MCR3722609.1 4-hydroxy-2-oxoheptanedioate aldolase [Prauserella flava]MCR3737051.1 4-hydroxy-2-oxoheptanedioate aldolase [Prauserella salsuginis]
MLTTNAVKQKIQAGEEVYGLFCSTPSPAMVEMIGCAGYDFVIIDTEHTLVDPQQVENMIRAAEAVGLTPFVRLAEGDAAGILRVLDGGAMGVVVAHVRHRSDVDDVVRAAKYAPEGMRSLNGGRVPGFGRLDLAEYVRRANEETMVVAMIEDAEGVDDIESILDGGGIDLVLEGAADLSQSYGVPWQTRHEVVREAVRKVSAACDARGVPFCAIPRERADHAEWLAAGVRTFVLGEERGIAARALRSHLDDHRRRG